MSGNTLIDGIRNEYTCNKLDVAPIKDILRENQLR